MEFGVTVPNNWGIDDPQAVIRFGVLAEELGYDSIWVMDHLFNNGYIRGTAGRQTVLSPRWRPSRTYRR